MEINNYIGREFVVTGVPDFVEDPAYYPEAGTKIQLTASGETYTYSVLSAVGNTPHGWAGMQFEYLSINDPQHILPDMPGINGGPSTPRQPADRLYGRSHILGVPFDIWFVAGRDAHIIDDTVDPPAVVEEPTSVMDCITKLVGSSANVQNGGHGTIPGD